MGLTMGQRQAVTKAIASRYRRASRADKGVILDELCAMTGWHRNHARKALGQALGPRRTVPWYAPWSATTATTPVQSCCFSTRFGCCSRR